MKFAKRIDLKWSQHTHTTMRSKGMYCDNAFHNVPIPISNYVVHFLYNFFSHTIPQAIVSGEVRRVGEKSISVEKITITDKQKNQIP